MTWSERCFRLSLLKGRGQGEGLIYTESGAPHLNPLPLRGEADLRRRRY